MSDHAAPADGGQVAADVSALLNRILDWAIANRGQGADWEFTRCYTYPRGEFPEWRAEAEALAAAPQAAPADAIGFTTRGGNALAKASVGENGCITPDDWFGWIKEAEDEAREQGRAEAQAAPADALSPTVQNASLREMAEAMVSAILDGTFADANEEHVRHAVAELTGKAEAIEWGAPQAAPAAGALREALDAHEWINRWRCTCGWSVPAEERVFPYPVTETAPWYDHREQAVRAALAAADAAPERTFRHRHVAAGLAAGLPSGSAHEDGPEHEHTADGKGQADHFHSPDAAPERDGGAK